MRKVLLDLLVKQFPQYNRERLLSYVLCGNVYWDEEKCPDPKAKFPKDALFHLQMKKYVSRGGYKLEGALSKLNFKVTKKVVVDAGASTGGFTDCLLQQGAAFVHAVDVGHNQLDYRLQQDPRVNNLDQTNILHVGDLDPVPHGAVADLSFRSLTNIVRHILDLTQEGWLIALVKPQFELEGNMDNFTGVLRDPQVLMDTLIKVVDKIMGQDFGIQALLPSPIRGRKGNQEYLMWITREAGLKREVLLQEIDKSLKDFTS